MDSDDKGDENMQVEIEIQNDSIVQLRRAQGQHPVFCIAQHPVHQDIIATGGGDDVGYIIDVSTAAAPTQPSPDGAQVEREVLNSIFTLDGHKDPINSIAFSHPKSQFVATRFDKLA
jgi:ribosome assembly protein SQT1